MYSPGGAKRATSHSTEASVHTRDRPPCTTDNRAPFPVHTHTSDFLGVGPLRMYSLHEKHEPAHPIADKVGSQGAPPTLQHVC